MSATTDVSVKTSAIDGQFSLPPREHDGPEELHYDGPMSTGNSLLAALARLPKWDGDDLEELLEEVIASRSKTYF